HDLTLKWYVQLSTNGSLNQTGYSNTYGRTCCLQGIQFSHRVQESARDLWKYGCDIGGTGWYTLDPSEILHFGGEWQTVDFDHLTLFELYSLKWDFKIENFD